VATRRALFVYTRHHDVLCSPRHDALSSNLASALVTTRHALPTWLLCSPRHDTLSSVYTRHYYVTFVFATRRALFGHDLWVRRVTTRSLRCARETTTRSLCSPRHDALSLGTRDTTTRALCSPRHDTPSWDVITCSPRHDTLSYPQNPTNTHIMLVGLAPRLPNRDITKWGRTPVLQ
jgi:hypothetical protein